MNDKAVLISIRSEWVRKILNGSKVVEDMLMIKLYAKLLRARMEGKKDG